MSSHTDQLNALSGHHSPDVPTGGGPTRIWAADVVTVNPDGSVDCQPVSSRATKVGVLCPGWYAPSVGDRVLIADLNGDRRTPIVLLPVSAAAALIAVATPPGASGETAGYTAGSSTAVTIDGRFTGGLGTTGYTIGDLVAALKNNGQIKK